MYLFAYSTAFWMTPFLLTSSWRSCLRFFFQREQEVEISILITLYLSFFHLDNQYTIRTMKFFLFSPIKQNIWITFFHKLNSVISYTTMNIQFLHSCLNAKQYSGMWEWNMVTYSERCNYMNKISKKKKKEKAYHLTSAMYIYPLSWMTLCQQVRSIK